MTRQKKIMAIKAEIENYEWKANGKIFFPLCDHLNELMKLFNIDDTANAEFIKRVNEKSIEKIEWCLEECKYAYNKDDKWINFTIQQFKEESSSAIWKFKEACCDLKVNSLSDEINNSAE